MPESNHAWPFAEPLEDKNRPLHQDSLSSPAANLPAQPRKEFENFYPVEQSDSELLGGCWIVLRDMSCDFVEIPLGFRSQRWSDDLPPANGCICWLRMRNSSPSAPDRSALTLSPGLSSPFT
jgi:hypothetical protein